MVRQWGMDDALRNAIARLGGVVRFSRAVGRPHSTILSWPRVPAERVVEIEEKTGIPRHELRPDLHLAPAAAPAEAA